MGSSSPLRSISRTCKATGARRWQLCIAARLGAQQTTSGSSLWMCHYTGRKKVSSGLLSYASLPAQYWSLDFKFLSSPSNGPLRLRQSVRVAGRATQLWPRPEDAGQDG